MRFVLLAGGHSDRNGLYVPGDVVTSDADLQARWPEKFLAWDDDDEVAAPDIQVPTVPQFVPPEDGGSDFIPNPEED